MYRDQAVQALTRKYTDSQSNQTVQEMTPKLIGIFEKVMSPPDEQLEETTRRLLQQTVQSLYRAKADLFSNNQGLLNLAGVS
jgi:hypothetical protein